jgi:hypothetical protein
MSQYGTGVKKMTDKKDNKKNSLEKGWSKADLPEPTEKELKALAKFMGVEDLEIPINERFIQYESPERQKQYLDNIKKEEASMEETIYQRATRPHKEQLMDRIQEEVASIKMSVEDFNSRGVEHPRWLKKKIAKVEEQLEYLEEE